MQLTYNSTINKQLTDDGATVSMRGDRDAVTGQLRDTVTDDTTHDHGVYTHSH